MTVDRPYLEKQAQLYLKVQSLDRKNDLLYRMGTNTDILTSEDIIDIYRNSGWLTQYQRQRVVNFISERLEIELNNWSDFSKENLVDTTVAGSNLLNALDLKTFEALVSEGVAEVDALQVTSLLDKVQRTLEEQDLVDDIWKQINGIESWEELNAFQTLVQNGIDEDDALLAAPIAYKSVRSPREQAIIIKVWKQLVNFSEKEHGSLDLGFSYQADLALAVQGFLEGISLVQIKQDIEAQSQNFIALSSLTKSLAQKIQYLDLVCMEAQAVTKLLPQLQTSSDLIASLQTQA